MEFWDQGWNNCRTPRQTWKWAILGTALVHGLIVSGMLTAVRDRPAAMRVVVPVEAVTLVPFKPGPKGGGGGRPAPVTNPEPQPVAAKPAASPKPKSRVKHRPQPQPRLAPLPATAPAPMLPPPPAALTRVKPATTAASPGTCAPNATASLAGTGRGGQGGGRGTVSGGGVGQGQGQGSGSGSALAGYLREVRQILEKCKDYPMMARRRNIQGVVVVVFTIAAGGRIESSRIKLTSGHDLLDVGAQNTIQRVGQFPPFPPGLDRQRLTVEVPLAFRLNND
jgi:protein TonB